MRRFKSKGRSRSAMAFAGIMPQIDKGREQAQVKNDTHDKSDDARIAEINKKLRPQIPDIDRFRQHQEKEYIKRKKLLWAFGWILMAPAVYIDYILLTMERSSSNDGGLGVSVLAFMGMVWWLKAPVRRYSRHFKQKTLPIVLKAFDPSFYYDPDASRSMSLFARSGLFHKGLNFTQDDHIFGKYKGVDFSFLEASFSTKGKHSRTVFKGGIIILKFPEKFMAHTMLKKDMGKIGNFFGGGKSRVEKEKFQRVELEDVDFEKSFEVYSTDQQEARYILSPALMQRVKSIHLGQGTKTKIQSAFFGHYAIFYLSYTEDLLEPPHITEPIVNLDPFVELLFQLDKICGVVDDLNMVFFAKRRAGAQKLDEMAASLDTGPDVKPNVKKASPTPAARAPSPTSPFTTIHRTD